jgi:hypothetical protein
MLHMAISNDQPDTDKKAASPKKHSGKTEEVFLVFVILAALFLLVITYRSELGDAIRSFWQAFPVYIVRWDVLIFIIFSSVVCGANLEYWKRSGPGPTLADFDPKDDPNYQTRTYQVNFFNYSATALKDVSSAYITAVSILIPASFVIIQVAKSVEPGKMPTGVTLGIPLLFRGVVWFLISLFFGILALYRVFTHGRYCDLSRSFWINVFLGSQFIGLFIGVLWLAAGLYYVVFR